MNQVDDVTDDNVPHKRFANWILNGLYVVIRAQKPCKFYLLFYSCASRIIIIILYH